MPTVCLQAKELVLHVLVECMFAQRTQYISALPLMNHAHSNFKDQWGFYSTCLSPMEKPKLQLSYGALGTIETPSCGLTNILYLLSSSVMLQCFQISGNTFITLLPPLAYPGSRSLLSVHTSKSHLKCIIDTTIDGRRSHASFGTIIRNKTGCFIVATHGSLPFVSVSNLAKGLACIATLQWLLSHGFEELVIES